MIIKSLLTVRHTINSIEEIKNWIDSRNKTVKVQVDSIPFSSLEGWETDENGTLKHVSGRFFSIEGIQVETDYGEF